MILEINDFYKLKIIALLGKPVEHSFSPAMQNAAYKFLKLNMLYTLCEADGGNLKHIANAIRCMPNYAGFALTTPNKIEIMQYLDEYDDLCSQIGSANTVIKINNKLKGYNTDGYGALCSLKESGCEIKDSVIFSFGAGGTGRSVCFELANAGAKKIYICSRSESCENLAENINKYFNKPCGVEHDSKPCGVEHDKCVPIRADDIMNVKNALDESSIILNLSGAGMTGQENLTCVDKNFLKPEHVCFDATYNPDKTRFLTEAAERGCKIINGLGMILYQGFKQIKLWSGIDELDKNVVEVMRGELLRIINKNK